MPHGERDDDLKRVDAVRASGSCGPRHDLTIMAVALAGLLPFPAWASDATCRRPEPGMAYACADPTIAASISALGVAYDIAMETAAHGPGGASRLRSGQAAWRRQVRACGTDEACISASILDRQRAINEDRLGARGAAEPEGGPARIAERPSAPPADPRPYEEIAREVAPAMPVYEQPRTDWPVPPQSAPFAMPAPGIPPAYAAAPHPNTVAAPEKSPVWRMLLGAALAVLVPGALAASFAIRRRKPRCPRCGGWMIGSRALQTQDPGYVRRMGPSNGMSVVRKQRIARRCPCGYASDAPVDGPSPVEARAAGRPELLLTAACRLDRGDEPAPPVL